MNVRIGVIVASVLVTTASGASAQDMITGLTAGGTYSDFQYPDHGEAVVPVFGSTMKLVVFNDDTKPIKITRLSVQAINR